MYHGTLAFT
jgi:hypothetical protein